MLKTIERKDYSQRRKAEILSFDGSSVISKTPMVILAKNGKTSTTIDIKTAAKFHGQISRDAAGEVDLIAEMTKHPEALWIRVKAIEADIPNDNGDCFSREEIIKAYKSFEGVPVFTNHENSKVENAKGKVVKAEWDDREGAVYCTMFVDRAANGPLCRAIEEGYVTDVSMGTQVEYSVCSVCEKKAFTADDYCDHVKTMKGRNVEGRKVFEKNFGLKFIELSVVTDGACKDCTIREIMDPEQYLTRVATAVSNVNSVLKVGQMVKDSGQAEIQKLNQAMDLLEDVSRAMLDQRQYIDLEFLQKVTEVLADLQHVNDELVDQGYGRMGDGDKSGMGSPQQMGLPPLPENSMPKQESGMEGPKPFLSGPSGLGAGTVTEPATASSGGKLLVTSRIKDLTEKVTKIYEEAKLSRSGGVTSDMDKEKANQTIAKLAKIWENPTIKDYETEVREGDVKILISGPELIGTYKGQKVASVKVADLDADLQQELKANKVQCASHLLAALRDKVAAMQKEAGHAPTNTKEQLEMTMESQLRTRKLPLHPRENEIRESTTEDQLRNKREGYDYHARDEGKPRESITEKQLNEGMKGYEYHKRQDKPRDETMELQIRNTSWQGNVTPADHKGEWVAGVSDQHEQTFEGQLEDWKKADKRHLPTDAITEKQLKEDAENWGRRIASLEDAVKAKTAAFKALAKTSVATGATPDEILSVISDFSSSPRNGIAAEAAVESLKAFKDVRASILSRAKFHGAAANASVADFMLGAMADEGMSGSVARETLEAIAEQKTASKQIADAIVAEKTEAKSVKAASSKDILRAAMTEAARDEISIDIPKASIKADEKDAEKFASAAYEAATKVAAKSGVRIVENVHVAIKGDRVEVAMLGVKETKPVAEKPAVDLEARKAARKDVVEKTAQMGGAMPGGDMSGGAGGGMPGPGGGTTMPPPPGGAGADPTAGVPPVAGLSAGGGMDEDPDAGGEALPPGSICPVCGSDNVDIRHGEFTCNDCGGAGEFQVSIHIKEWPNVIEDTEPKGKGEDTGEAEGGIGDMGGGAGMEMPQVGMQQAFVLTPNMVKIAGGKPVGSFCPHCGSNKTKLAMNKGAGKGKCETCKGEYAVKTEIDVKSKSLKSTVAWIDRQVTKLAGKLAAEKTLAKQAAKERNEKKAALENALRKSGLTAKFAKADLNGKADIIAHLADKKLLSK